MSTKTTNFDIKTPSRDAMIDITSMVQTAVRDAGVTEGTVIVHIPHTTAGVTINENADASVVADLLMSLERLVPEDGNYRHSEGNSDAHCKASLMGSSVTVPVNKGTLVLGTWQGIFFCEFDGPRSRQFQVVGLAGGE